MPVANTPKWFDRKKAVDGVETEFEGPCCVH